MIPTYKLRDGYQIPQIGFGTWQLADHDVCYNYYFTSSKSEYIKYDYGIIEENEINENWSSMFSNIPYD